MPTICISRIFCVGDLRSGQFCDLPIIRQWEKNHIPHLRIRPGYFIINYVRVLLMIQVHILVGDLNRGHLGSYDVIRGH